jgi:hypothetical protein
MLAGKDWKDFQSCLNQVFKKCFNLKNPFRSFGNRLFYSFLGIPFAKPPIGERRFKLPEPVEPWTETFEADKHLQCTQVFVKNSLNLALNCCCLKNKRAISQLFKSDKTCQGPAKIQLKPCKKTFLTI